MNASDELEVAYSIRPSRLATAGLITAARVLHRSMRARLFARLRAPPDSVAIPGRNKLCNCCS
jgi:hypothetical protein